MKALRTLRCILWALVFIAVIVLGMTFLGWRAHEDPRKSDANLTSIAIGGPFTMIDHTGKTVTGKAFAGRPFIMFFGFTRCPDICPTTLSSLSDLVEQAEA